MRPSSIISRHLFSTARKRTLSTSSHVYPFSSQALSQTRRQLQTPFTYSRPSHLQHTIQNTAKHFRHNSSVAVPEDNSSTLNPNPPPREPAYQLTFTCKPCSTRSSHQITKQGYHNGTVLITCPSCKNRHIISDHLKIFMDEKSTLEDILARKAGPGGDLSRLLKKGRLGIREGSLVGNEGEEDIEFWEDGTETKKDDPK